jgi:hypothetical protein
MKVSVLDDRCEVESPGAVSTEDHVERSGVSNVTTKAVGTRLFWKSIEMHCKII